MFRITLSLFFILLIAATASGQSAPPVQWDTTRHNFEVVKIKNPNSFKFTFENVGDFPIRLDNVRTNCRCILPYWANEEIPPNGVGEIFIILTIEKSGIFTKEVLVTFDGYREATTLKVVGYTDDVDDLIVQKSVKEITDMSDENGGNSNNNEEISENIPGDPFRKKKEEALPDIYNQEEEKPLDEYAFMTKREQSMIEEINLLRSNPKGYVLFIEDYINALQEEIDNGGASNKFYKEEIKAATELIGVLKSTPALSILKPHSGIYEAARLHGMDMTTNEFFGHKGTDDSLPWDRIMKNATDIKDANENLVGGPYEVRQAIIILLVDTGIQDRGHRKTLLQPDWEYVACYEVGQINKFTNCWIQNFGRN